MYAIRLLTDYVKNLDFTVFKEIPVVLGSILLLYGLFRVIFRRLPNLMKIIFEVGGLLCKPLIIFSILSF